MPRRATLRASDSDREAVADRLRRAAGEGRLATDELEQRLEAALSARTYSELDRLVADLPGSGLAMPRRPRQAARLRPALGLVVAIPIAVAVLVGVLLAVTGVLAMWWLWFVVGWWFFGHHRRGSYRARYGRPLGACGPWQRSRVPRETTRGFWA